MSDLPQIGKKYTYDEVQRMSQAHPGLTIPGHVLRRDNDGMYSIVPEVQAAGAFGRGRALRTGYRSKEGLRDIFPTEPIRKRTPQQRLDSLQKNTLSHAQGLPGIPGLTEEKVQELVGKSWKQGTPLTAEQVRAAAATLLQRAESRFEAAESRKVVRTAPSD